MASLQLEEALMHRLLELPEASRRRITGNTRVASYPFKVEALLGAAVKSAFSRVRYESLVPSSYEKQDDMYSVFYEVVRAITALLASSSPISWVGVDTMVSTALFNLRAFKAQEAQKYMKAILGKRTIPYNDAWWEDVERSLRDELGRRLAGSISEYTTKLSKYITRVSAEKISYNDAVVGIKGIMGDISDARAAFLARDLTGSVNSISTQKLHVNVFGINTYLWVTAADERVRGTPGGPYASAIPSHYVMERLLCRWDNPGVYSQDGGVTWQPRNDIMPHAHAGMPYQCRCVSEAYLPGTVTQTKARLQRNK